MRIINRLDKYIEFKGINDNQVTMNSGLSVGLLGKARQGKSDIGKKSIDKILNFYQDLNKTWLLTGEGEMLLDTEGQKLNKYTKTAKNDADLQSKAFTYLVFSMYEKEKGYAFSFDSFIKLKEIFDLASMYTEILQDALEVDISSDVLKSVKQTPQFNDDGNYILSQSLINSIDKYATVYKNLKEVANNLMDRLHEPTIQKEIIEYVKNKL
jgi:hypothetical protein